MTGRAHALHRVPGLADLARLQSGVVRRQQLAELGVSRHHIRQQVESARWRVIGPHVVVLQTGPLHRRQQLHVAVLHAGPASALAGRTALEHDGLRGWERRDLHVLVPRGIRVPRLRSLVVHETTYLPAEHVRPGPPGSCIAARAVVDAASWESQPASATALVLAVIQRGLATAGEVVAVLDQLPRSRHALAIRNAIVEADAGSESLSELKVLRALEATGLGPVRRQVVVETSQGPREVDMVVALPDGRLLAVQVDGPHHLDPRQRARDAWLDAELVALGYVVLHVPVAALGDLRWLQDHLARMVGRRPA